MSEPSIAILTQRLAESEIDPQLRDALASDLDWAAQINGNPDPSMQGVKRLVVCGVRRELLSAARDRATQETIANIVEHCRSRHERNPDLANKQIENAIVAESGGKFAVFMATVRALTPWRWPLALAACSPWSASLVQALTAAFSK